MRSRPGLLPARVLGFLLLSRVLTTAQAQDDALRLYALRLHEAGLIKSSPKKLIADGADWRILYERRRS